MSGSAFSQRIANFKNKFQQVLGPKRQGYGELSQLEQPLVENDAFPGSNDNYVQMHGVQHPNNYKQSNHAALGVGPVPSQSEELQLLTSLGRDAAEILWEMAALGDDNENTKDMLEKATQLQAQLRGMVSDFSDCEESLMAQALEVFDILSNTLNEYQSAKPPMQAAVIKETVGQSAPGKNSEEEPPLISFD